MAKSSTPCIGDLNKRLTLLTRQIRPPVQGATDFTERFTRLAKVWGKVNTPGNAIFFDGVNQDVRITHRIVIRYRDDVDTEIWVELPSGNRLRIVSIRDLFEDHEWLELACTVRGPEDVQAAQA